jgi:hypothetical protein
MPMLYDIVLATEANITTNATPNTETEVYFVKAGTRNCALQSIYLVGKGSSLTSITGIEIRLVRWTTASTAGTAITPTPVDPGMQASKCTAASLPTLGTTRLNRLITGCGAAGPGGWIAPNVDSMPMLEGGGAMSHDLISASGVASMNFACSMQVQE